MLRIFWKTLLFVGAVLLTGLPARAQQPKADRKYIDLAVTYTAERAKVASIDCGCFWLHGGSFDGAYTFYHGLGVAANLTGAHASQFGNGLDLDKVTFAMGPRYTYHPSKKLPFFKQDVALFGEGLIGGAHGFNSTFPSASGSQGAASSFAVQAGGGVDLRITRVIGVRIVEAHYTRSAFPNNEDNVQHDLQLSGGISFHFSR